MCVCVCVRLRVRVHAYEAPWAVCATAGVRASRVSCCWCVHWRAALYDGAAGRAGMARLELIERATVFCLFGYKAIGGLGIRATIRSRECRTIVTTDPRSVESVKPCVALTCGQRLVA